MSLAGQMLEWTVPSGWDLHIVNYVLSVDLLSKLFLSKTNNLNDVSSSRKKVNKERRH